MSTALFVDSAPQTSPPAATPSRQTRNPALQRETGFPCGVLRRPEHALGALEGWPAGAARQAPAGATHGPAPREGCAAASFQIVALYGLPQGLVDRRLIAPFACFPLEGFHQPRIQQHRYASLTRCGLESDAKRRSFQIRLGHLGVFISLIRVPNILADGADAVG